ncbi:MAG: hypothetical protein LLG00_17330 [Planctomycetaceae bacterium]|nr:hypothetical protein [Planctomycetaceae bacterium]
MLQRLSLTTNLVVVGTAVEASKSIGFRSFAGGHVHLPTNQTGISKLSWYASWDDVTFFPVYDGAGNPVTTTIAAGTCCLIPAACFACAYLKAVAIGAADTGGAVVVTLKA